MKIQVILGPTAAGKTNYAISLAKQHGGAVISADSRQVYTDMNIGTAKPQEAWGSPVHGALMPDMIEGVPHFLFNIASPNAFITLSHWQQAAKEVLADLSSKNTPIYLVGGTMLYIDSIVDWYTIPEVAPNQGFREELETLPTEQLYEQLVQKDPGATVFIEPHHKRRIIRALEVIKATGKPFSVSRARQQSPYECSLTGIFPGFEIMRERVTTRAESMFAEGLLEETQKLEAMYGADLPLLQTMNYKQAALHLKGEMSLKEAIQDTVKVNMRYVHRQMSWWNRRTDIKWI